MRPDCIDCGKPADSKGHGRWHKKCTACRKTPWVIFKGDDCDLCGFVPVNKCQLDVDHIDGNKANNDPSNLQTLCANCHRLKTFLNNDHLDKERCEFESLQVSLF